MPTINNRFENLTLERLQEIYDLIITPGSIGLAVGVTPITGGAVGRVLFEGAGNVLQESANLFWDNTNGRLGIGTATPVSRLHVGGLVGTLATGLTFGSGVSGIYLLDNTTMNISINNANRFWFRSTDFYPDVNIGIDLGLTSRRWKTLNTQQITDNGTNVLIGTATDSGFKLDVNGTTMLRSSVNGVGSGGAAIPLLSTFGTNVAIVGGGTANPIRVQGQNFGVIISSTVMGLFHATAGNLTLQNGGTFTDAGFRLDVNGTTMLRGIVYGVGSGGGAIQLLTTAGTGTAVIGGNTGTPLRFQGQNLQLLVGSTQVGLFHATTGNLTLQNGGTFTDAGYRLDVNGTARVQGNAQFGTGFYWDNTNNRLGINTASPSQRLTVIGVASTAPTNSTWISSGSPIGSFYGEGAIGNMDFFIGGASSTALARPVLVGRKSGGTLAVPTALAIGDSVFSFLSSGYSGTQFLNTASINMLVDGTVSSTSVPQAITFETGTTSRSERMRIASSGNLLIGTTTDAGYKLDVQGTSRFTGSAVFNSAITVGGAVAVNNSLAVGTNQVLEASAQLEVKSTTKGLLFPRMTTTQKNAIASPAAGLVVYDTTLGKLCVRTASAWETITSV